VRISLKRAGDSAVLEIHDDGHGFDTTTSPPPGVRHRGLHNMVERARLIGGNLEVKSASGGTSVCLVLPL